VPVIAAAAPAEHNVRIQDRRDLLKNIRDFEVVFRQDLMLSTCALDGKCGLKHVERFGDCFWLGNSSKVLHARRLDSGEERAVKIYHYAEDHPSRQDLQKVYQRLTALDSPIFVKGTFRTDGVTLLLPGTETLVGTFDVAVMEGGIGRQPREILPLENFTDPDRRWDRSLQREIAKRLRSAFAELHALDMAHSDLCPSNIGVEVQPDRPESTRIFLIDIDSLVWQGYTRGAAGTDGHKGYYTPGRSRDPKCYVSACAGRLPMIDAPAEIVCYLNLIGQLLSPRLRFLSNDLDGPGDLRDKIQRFKIALGGNGARCVHMLLDALNAHCASSYGIDMRFGSPFTNESNTAFQQFEDSL
jgi:hypothetical protein